VVFSLYEGTVLGTGRDTVGSWGRGVVSLNEFIAAEGNRTELHGLSSVVERAVLSGVAQGLLAGSVKESSPLTADDEDDASPQALSVSLPRNSAVFPAGSLSSLPVFLKSFATPTYASCTAEKAAEAFEESFPQTDLTPLLDKNSGGLTRERLSEFNGFGEGVRAGHTADDGEA
jgi:hypothetical protein